MPRIAAGASLSADCHSSHPSKRPDLRNHLSPTFCGLLACCAPLFSCAATPCPEQAPQSPVSESPLARSETKQEAPVRSTGESLPAEIEWRLWSANDEIKVLKTDFSIPTNDADGLSCHLSAPQELNNLSTRTIACEQKGFRTEVEVSCARVVTVPSNVFIPPKERESISQEHGRASLKLTSSNQHIDLRLECTSVTEFPEL